MKKINSSTIGSDRRQLENAKSIAKLDHDLRLTILAYETRQYWDELNAKLFLEKFELTKLLSSIDPASKNYKDIKEELKKVEMLYKDILLQIDFTYSFSGRGDNPFVFEDKFIGDSGQFSPTLLR